MEITYATKEIRRLCEEEKHQLRQLGKERSRRLKNRLNELRAKGNVSELQLGRPHELTEDRAGQYSVDLDGPRRLLFESTELPPPALPAGGIDWQQVKSIRILGIEDTHE